MKKIIRQVIICIITITILSQSIALAIPAKIGIEDILPTSVASGKCGENLKFEIMLTKHLEISGSGDMYNFDDQDAPWKEYAESIESVSINDGVEFIGNYAFFGLTSLKKVTISDSVTEIGYGAFKNCTSLSSISIPDDVYIIGSSAFEGCSNLQSITLPSSLKNVYHFTFAMCKNLKEIEISNDVQEIGQGAFTNCLSLETVYIPDTVKKLGNRIFYGCNSLETIYYSGDKSQWEMISIGSGNSELNNIEVIYLSEDKNEDNVICSICETEILNNKIFYDDDENIMCELCSKSQTIELECPHCSATLEITEDEYNERNYIVCPDCMKFIVYEGEDTEYECFGCGEIFYHSETKVVENGKIYCPYCNEIVDGDNIEPETECYICGEYFNADEMEYDEDNYLICQECYNELQNEDEEVFSIQCPHCKEIFDDSNDIYDEDGNAVCPYCYEYIDYYEDISYEIECPHCGETFEDNEDVYDEYGYAVCPYCEGLTDTSNETPEETELELTELKTSDWAIEEVCEAYINNLIPQEMLNDSLKYPICREEFAAIAVKLFENIGGKVPYADLTDTPFTDCDEYGDYANYIAAAYKLGITTGTSSTSFSPYDTITREQLATMIYRVLKHKEAKGWDWWFTCNKIKLRNIWKYDDDSDINDYAIDAIYYLSKIPVVKGVSDGIFAPGNTATREEAILMALRGYKYVINPSNYNNIGENQYFDDSFAVTNFSNYCGYLPYSTSREIINGKTRITVSYDVSSLPISVIDMYLFALGHTGYQLKEYIYGNGVASYKGYYANDGENLLMVGYMLNDILAVTFTESQYEEMIDCGNGPCG
ncbi:MAG: hypothetical protein E7395_03575 [Ruminococcaceae bacterium]|nr:hypothetical protein [Oscillospiraceae bacterium]